MQSLGSIVTATGLRLAPVRLQDKLCPGSMPRFCAAAGEGAGLAPLLPFWLGSYAPLQLRCPPDCETHHQAEAFYVPNPKMGKGKCP